MKYVFSADSPHKANVDRAILKLQEAGVLSVLKHKWWTLEDNTERCSDAVSILIYLITGVCSDT